MHYQKGNPSKSPYICIVWSLIPKWPSQEAWPRQLVRTPDYGREMTLAKGTKWPKTCHQSATSTTSKTLTSHCDSLTQPTSIQVSVLAHFYFHLHHLVNFQLSFNMSKHSRRASASCRSTCTRNTKTIKDTRVISSLSIYISQRGKTLKYNSSLADLVASSLLRHRRLCRHLNKWIQSLCHIFSSTNLVASLTCLLSWYHVDISVSLVYTLRQEQCH